MTDHDSESGCAGACDAHPIAPDRRAFLRAAAVSAAGTLIALGSRAADAMARPLSFIASSGRTARGQSYAIPAADGVEIDRENEVILARWQGAVYAFNLSCPHQNTALRVDDSVGFQCPKHHSKYAGDGKYLSGRATRSMDRLAITRDGANVMVDVDTLWREDRNPTEYAAAVVRVA